MRRIRYIVGVGAVAALLAGCLPPKPAPPPPPKFKLAAGLWHTFGTAPGAAECHFARITASGATVDDVHSVKGARYVQTAADDQEFQTSGCQNWVLADSPGDVHNIGVPNPNPTGQPGAPPTAKMIAGDGDYRVGGIDWPNAPGDAQWGEYQLQNDNCHWERLSDFSGNPGTVIASGGPEGDGFPGTFPGTFTVHQTDAGFRVFNCGFTPTGNMFWYGTPGGA